MAAFRHLKRELGNRLDSPDWEGVLEHYRQLPLQDLVSPLMALFYRLDEVTWRAVTLLGQTIGRMADETPDKARIVMRRLMWHLNEESGNLGWGAPETLGEAMANHPGLAREYHCILWSYIRQGEADGNFLDHGPLRQGVIWGLGRLAQAHPTLAAKAKDDLLLALHDPAPSYHGHALWALAQLREAASLDAAEVLLPAHIDPAATVHVFHHRRLRSFTMEELARP